MCRRKKLTTLLESGTHVICDRYSYSGVAFSGEHSSLHSSIRKKSVCAGAKEGMTVNWCWAPETGLPAPDSVIYLDLPIEKAMLRGQ